MDHVLDVERLNVCIVYLAARGTFPLGVGLLRLHNSGVFFFTFVYHTFSSPSISLVYFSSFSQLCACRIGHGLFFFFSFLFSIVLPQSCLSFIFSSLSCYPNPIQSNASASHLTQSFVRPRMSKCIHHPTFTPVFYFHFPLLPFFTLPLSCQATKCSTTA